ncbi:16S rRNA (guanine(966)-N(2))-methyltransferase RsmD [Clostridium sp. MB40-C1]|uniref:16S rRNA (guanine(966)-N(2))-methyltransferase RsmD n=1 Tax=Clostridium sp. MB40-C1 TaxID=3070996 RepID=UPI0027E1A0E2|nr:16S rRNA (guanine(966)-N(2))-methyltransferase RsmD [Clostridium sp. MB40-C1]WMJ82085.1 16S rRNA (guanine(966)-N(2))-methyltransferase RsmD [Clostridium sp. MB40-C1]
MRIIAGKAKGRTILPPDGMQTRPTLDRVKENIFNIIQNRTLDAVVIDVFAGTGSLGLEAASRGAEQCYLVDKHPTTFKRLKQNVESLKFEQFCTCLNMDSYDALREVSRRGKVFDLIFIDPPYAKEMIPPAMEIVFEKELLKKDGLIITKIDSSENIYQGYKDIVLINERKYGNTTVCLYAYEEE